MAGARARFEVLLTEGAEQDLEAIHDYISDFACVANLNALFDEKQRDPLSGNSVLSGIAVEISPLQASDRIAVRCP